MNQLIGRLTPKDYEHPLVIRALNVREKISRFQFIEFFNIYDKLNCYSKAILKNVYGFLKNKSVFTFCISYYLLYVFVVIDPKSLWRWLQNY